MMEYKGYLARVEFDETVNVFHGRVANTRDVLAFESDTVKGLWREFRATVDDYLFLCKTRGEAPDKPFSGKFNIRLEPDLHRRVALAAAASGKSLNGFVAETLSHAVPPRT